LNRNVLIALSAIVAILYLYLLFVVERDDLRLGVVSLAQAFLAADAARSMLRRVPAGDRTTYWPTGIVFVFVALPLALRAITDLSGGHHGSVLSPIPVEIAWTICADIAFVGSAFGMLLASNTRLRHEAEAMSLYDPLTNLPNRRFFLDRLLKAEHHAQTTGRRFGVIYLDLDGFKMVNDTLGHDAGDDMLRNISTAMTGIVGSQHCLARVGGDEFVVLAEDIVDRSELADLGARLKAAVAREPTSSKLPAPIHVSCGVAMFPDDGESAHDVMREADTEMFQAKRRGRAAGHSAGS
jgi:diguanylate cyclase (GGDEF)-like protein